MAAATRAAAAAARRGFPAPRASSPRPTPTAAKARAGPSRTRTRRAFLKTRAGSGSPRRARPPRAPRWTCAAGGGRCSGPRGPTQIDSATCRRSPRRPLPATPPGRGFFVHSKSLHVVSTRRASTAAGRFPASRRGGGRARARAVRRTRSFRETRQGTSHVDSSGANHACRSLPSGVSRGIGMLFFPTSVLSSRSPSRSPARRTNRKDQTPPRPPRARRTRQRARRPRTRAPAGLAVGASNSRNPPPPPSPRPPAAAAAATRRAACARAATAAWVRGSTPPRTAPRRRR